MDTMGLAETGGEAKNMKDTEERGTVAETVDHCAVCAGAQGPDHRHACASCGADAGTGALVVGVDGEDKEFYCNRFCIYEVDPDHPLVSDVTSEQWERERERREVERDMRLLKQRAAEVGVPWN